MADEDEWAAKAEAEVEAGPERYVDITGSALAAFFVQREPARAMSNPVPVCGNCGELASARRLNARESDMVCVSCGLAVHFLGSNLSYKHPTIVRKSDGYKRINHFNERLMQLQGKEVYRVAPNIVAEIGRDLAKYCVVHITPKRVREALKRCGFSQLYEHSVQISLLLGGSAPYRLTAEEEERLRFMFRQVQEPYERCPTELKMDPLTKRVKKNFIRYSYFLYKACELLELDHVLSSLSLLKAVSKRMQHDRIWEYICGELGWDFIPSVPFETA